LLAFALLACPAQAADPRASWPRSLVITSDEERTRNDQFTPCCSRARSAMLVLDL
jgi:hypothetical protein